MSEQDDRKLSITEEYEQKVLAAFKAWYQQRQPTMYEASLHAGVIARDAVGGLTTTHVICLLQEHEWTHERPREICDSDKWMGLTIGEVARRHLIAHLEQVIQQRGFQVVCEQEQ